jgi:hypothetical protein
MEYKCTSPTETKIYSTSEYLSMTLRCRGAIKMYYILCLDSNSYGKSSIDAKAIFVPFNFYTPTSPTASAEESRKITVSSPHLAELLHTDGIKSAFTIVLIHASFMLRNLLVMVDVLSIFKHDDVCAALRTYEMTTLIHNSAEVVGESATQRCVQAYWSTLRRIAHF